jgi:hypothetical protein
LTRRANMEAGHLQKLWEALTGMWEAWQSGRPLVQLCVVPEAETAAWGLLITSICLAATVKLYARYRENVRAPLLSPEITANESPSTELWA